jgi:tetratricopeptide (TPR) repeat protein
MANMFTDTGRVEKAVPLLREALRTSPNNAEIHWELGYAYRYAGLLQDSVLESESARRLDPSVKINSSTPNGYLYLGQYDKFIDSLPPSRTNHCSFFTVVSPSITKKTGVLRRRTSTGPTTSIEPCSRPKSVKHLFSQYKGNKPKVWVFCERLRSESRNAPLATLRLSTRLRKPMPCSVTRPPHYAY